MNKDNQQETDKVSDLDIGWLAGIIDGEGSVSLSFGMIKAGRLNNLSPRIEVCNTDKEITERFVRIVNAIGSGCYLQAKKESVQSELVRERRGLGFKPLYCGKVVGFRRTKKVLDVVTPHLTGEKQSRATMLLAFVNNRMQKTNDLGKHTGGRIAYDAEDYNLAIAIAKTMRTKFVPILEGLLRDCTRGRWLTPSYEIVRTHVRA